jgi:hypothetical protein
MLQPECPHRDRYSFTLKETRWLRPNEICAAVISRTPRLRLDHILRNYESLAARLSAEPSTAESGEITCMLKLGRVCRGRVPLTGDAVGCLDAITGEGLGLAFQHAEAPAEALLQNSLELYEVAKVTIGFLIALWHRVLETRPAPNLLAGGARLAWHPVASASAESSQCDRGDVPCVSGTAVGGSAGRASERGSLIRNVLPVGEVLSTITEPP